MLTFFGPLLSHCAYESYLLPIYFINFSTDLLAYISPLFLPLSISNLYEKIYENYWNWIKEWILPYLSLFFLLFSLSLSINHFLFVYLSLYQSPILFYRFCNRDKTNIMIEIGYYVKTQKSMHLKELNILRLCIFRDWFWATMTNFIICFLKE